MMDLRSLGSAPRTRWCGSAVELLSTVVTAASCGDEEGLRRLRIDEFEYTAILWPEFPASPREGPLRAEVWRHVDERSRRGERWLCDQLGGKPWTIADLTVGRAIDRYRTFTIHRGTIIRLATPDASRTVTLLGGIVEYRAGYKVLSILEP